MKALITGATSGIGKEMAKYLDELGYDLIIVSKDKEKLTKVKKEFNRKVKAISLDLSVEDNCYKLYNEVKEENIDILINNAGFGDFGEFSKTSLDKELNMINLNIKAYHILTKLFLNYFKKKDYGRILNVASMAGFMPGVYMATYYATKAYVVNLSLAISEELKLAKSNVKISVFCPGPVATNFNNIADVKFNIKSISSNYAARYAIDNMFRDKLTIVPPNMKLSKMMIKIMPEKLILIANSKMQQRK